MPEPAQLEGRTTELLQRLIRFNTVNPPGDEQAAQEFLRDTLAAAGFECELLSAVAGRPNLIARLRGQGDGPTLCLCGHVDTVLADPADWSVDPWSGELRDGQVWGRGALDMKSQVAAEVVAACALAEEGWRPAGELLVVITADEEAGAEQGAQWLCTEHPDKVRCDYMVNEGAGEIVHFGGRRVYGVCVAEKGVFRFTITTEGRAGHASIPRIGDNALTKLAPLLQAMRDRQPSLELSPEPESLLSALGLDPSDPDAALREAAATDPRVAVIVEPLLGVTLTPTMVHASDKINVIPAQASVKVDCRVPPGLGRDHAVAKIREVLGEDGFSIAFDEQVIGNRSPIETPLMDAIDGWVEEVDPGAQVAATGLPGFTDSRWWREAFPECVAYGFFPQREMDLFEAAPLVHGADERVPVADLGFAAGAYVHICRELLS
ncbi:MAG TPA: M20/M25/M40 family metallo-hydrolase [Thermoleophilaceae bacterium]|nr:M20/M25/M40 family metallo-hydrolase [Thermoleophilaceae bacterium]